jgi:hypothetical protein
MVLGNTWASVFQTSIDAQAFVLLENPPSIYTSKYTSNSHGKDLTKCGQEPLMYGFLPQVFAHLVSYSLYRWECAIRSAAILGLVGAGGLGQQIELSMRMFQYHETSTILIIVFVLVTGVDHLSAVIRKAL